MPSCIAFSSGANAAPPAALDRSAAERVLTGVAAWTRDATSSGFPTVRRTPASRFRRCASYGENGSAYATVPRGPGGRPRIEDRAALEGILFVLDTGCRWRDLPEQLGCGSGHTAWRRLREWQDAGVWDRLHRLVLDELSDAQLLDWSRGCVDGVSGRSKRGAS